VPGLSQEHQLRIFQIIQGRILSYSIHKHACRVIQTALEVFPIDLKVAVAKEILDSGKLIECSFDFNGNHVVQQIVIQLGQRENCPVTQQVLKIIESNAVGFSVNEFCCRIMQRVFEKSTPKLFTAAGESVSRNFPALSDNEYGVFVLSSILENGTD
jgi:hypothetical protein